MSMLCVPEGGMNYDWDLTYIIDGQPFLVRSGPLLHILSRDDNRRTCHSCPYPVR